MRPKIVIFAFFISFFTSAGFAAQTRETVSGYCESVGDLARNIMKARLTGTPKEAILQNLPSGSGADIARGIVGRAYEFKQPPANMVDWLMDHFKDMEQIRCRADMAVAEVGLPPIKWSSAESDPFEAIHSAPLSGPGFCKALSNVASNVMTRRQDGALASDLMEKANREADPGLRRVLIDLTGSAYDKPRYVTSEHRQSQIQDFTNDVYMLCMNGKNGQTR